MNQVQAILAVNRHLALNMSPSDPDRHQKAPLDYKLC
jgi:hypothetical protein